MGSMESTTGQSGELTQSGTGTLKVKASTAADGIPLAIMCSLESEESSSLHGTIIMVVVAFLLKMHRRMLKRFM